MDAGGRGRRGRMVEDRRRREPEVWDGMQQKGRLLAAVQSRDTHGSTVQLGYLVMDGVAWWWCRQTARGLSRGWEHGMVAGCTHKALILRRSVGSVGNVGRGSGCWLDAHEDG
jgi:hypothetical protein